jgi:hypothetical protein
MERINRVFDEMLFLEFQGGADNLDEKCEITSSPRDGLIGV